MISHVLEKHSEASFECVRHLEKCRHRTAVTGVSSLIADTGPRYSEERIRGGWVCRPRSGRLLRYVLLSLALKRLYTIMIVIIE